MKRALRSTFDPLPRSVSTKGLTALVAVVVLGTAVTTFRYLESSSATTRHASPGGRSHAALHRPGEVRAAGSEMPGSGGGSCAQKSRSWSAPNAGASCPRVESASSDPVPVAPTLYRPDHESSGS